MLKDMNNIDVDMSQNTALIMPSAPKMPLVTGYPKNPVFPRTTQTTIVHIFLLSQPAILSIK